MEENETSQYFQKPAVDLEAGYWGNKHEINAIVKGNHFLLLIFTGSGGGPGSAAENDNIKSVADGCQRWPYRL